MSAIAIRMLADNPVEDGAWAFVSIFKKLEPVATVLGACGAVFTAVVATLINIEISEQTEQQAQIERSISIAQFLHQDAIVSDLQLLASSVELEINRERLVSEDFDYKESQAKVVAQMVATTQLKPLANVFLQHINRVVICRNRSLAETSHLKACDNDTMLFLVGETAFDIVLKLRPLFFCDRDFNGGLNISYTFLEDFVRSRYEAEYRRIDYHQDDKTDICEAYAKHLRNEEQKKTGRKPSSDILKQFGQYGPESEVSVLKQE